MVIFRTFSCHCGIRTPACFGFGVWGGNRHEGGGKAATNVIRVNGSDTMVNLAQAWAERYSKKHPEVSVQVKGGGSGVGIASLIDGNCDLANTSRKMSKSEIQRARSKRGGEPKEIIVGYDALAIYVHKDNPLETISIEELADIYGEDGKIEQWSQLGREGRQTRAQEVTRVSRQSSSGTYTYFREVDSGARQGLQVGIDRPERLEGRGGAGRAHALGNRLQRHGLSHAGSENVEGLETPGRAGHRADRRKREEQLLSHHPAAPDLRHRRAGRSGERVPQLDSIARGPEDRARPGLRAQETA